MANTKIPSELSSTPSISDSGNATAITINSSEQVGIGTTLSEGNIANVDGLLTLKSTESGSHNALAFAWEHSNITNNIEQRISWGFGDDATANAYSAAGYIGMGKENIYQVDAERDSYLAFATAENATVSEHLRITSAGNVGIGTTSPTEKLTVAGAITATGAISADRTSTAAIDHSSNITRIFSFGDGTSGGAIAFRTSAAGGVSTTQRMTINSDGNVTMSKGLTVGTTVQPTSGELDGTGQSGTNVLTIGDTTKSLPAILMRSSVTNGNWLADYTNTSGHLNSYNTDTNKTTMSQKSDGSVNFPNQPSFMAYSNTAGTTGFITFTATHHNIGSHYNTSNGRFTAPVAGRYLFTFAILLNPDTNGEYCRILFAINGNTSVTYGDTLQDLNFSSLSDYHAVCASTILSLSANDYVQLKNDSQFGTYGGSYGSFCGQLLS